MDFELQVQQELAHEELQLAFYLKLQDNDLFHATYLASLRESALAQ
jgi:hypothetical protein